jgi:RimJ/RimL family protein N-acetyltransferase
MTVATGQKVSLRRASLADRRRVYEWMAWSDLTAGVMGPPLYADHPIPSFDEFCEAYEPHYFDGSRPFDGRGLILAAGDTDVGFLAYSQINLYKDVVELDLWLAGRRHCGKGYGSEALALGCEWLQDSFGVNRFLVRPSRRNVHALRAMRRAGFRETDLPPGDVIGKLDLPRGHYVDELLLFRILPLPRARLDVDRARSYVFVDSEFTNLVEPRLISVGAVSSDAAAFYCELNDWPLEHCSDFVQRQVLPLLDGDAVPHPVAAESFARWIARRAERAPLTIVSDSGFDRWALADLLGREDLPRGVDWVRVPVAYESLDAAARDLGLRRHHALDDARALRHALLGAPG